MSTVVEYNIKEKYQSWLVTKNTPLYTIDSLFDILQGQLLLVYDFWNVDVDNIYS